MGLPQPAENQLYVTQTYVKKAGLVF